jgi:hypothetical protein
MSDHIHSAPTTPEFTTDNDVVMDEPSSSRSSIPAWLTTSPSTPALSNDGSPSTATNYSTPSASNAFDDGLYTHDSIMTGGVDSGLSLPASFDFNPFGDKNMPSGTCIYCCVRCISSASRNAAGLGQSATADSRRC